ncbi:acyltransferase family protein [Demequina sp. NBRC 110056]|uniref:acyltransferase family protein n=1 Tax=Demequina sp. NBRC 110056 TaxID=1570345 RepID=UPI0009FCD815|nr:acyltransferase family protein [Demequina sp. NBRC 110056]
MPRPVGSHATYRPGLDGLRALAVVGVVAYHLGAPWAPGGLMGVGVFFTLSGFLITTILLRTWQERGDLDLGRFWLRRARRLVPALVAVVAVTLGVTAVIAPADGMARLRESLAGLLYASNWTTIAAGESYFDRFAGPGPLDHLWSLAIEEQFYLVWPLLLLGLLALTRRRLWRVAGATLGLAAVSFLAMWLLAEPGFDHTRVYQGTDTRAGGLLIGAALAIAMVAFRTGSSKPSPERTPWWLDILGLVALAVVGWQLATTDAYAMSLYGGGLALLSVATAVVVAAASHQRGLVGWLLGLAPLRWLGERSYGIYLWHMPIIAFLPAALGPWTAALAVPLTLVLAWASWRWLEDPIRVLGLRWWLDAVARRLRTWAEAAGRRVAPEAAFGRRVLASTAIAATVVVASTGAAVALTVRVERAVATASAAPQVVEALPVAPDAEPVVPPIAATPSATAGELRESGGVEVTFAGPRTSCTSVVHVGDSTSLGLVGEGTPADKQIAAQYARVGVDAVDTDVRGARSIVERFKGEPNAQDAVEQRVDDGYQGCWVIAMGINEAANQAVGGAYPVEERIERILSLTGDDPVLWVNAVTRLDTGAYADAGMQEFNAALAKACAAHPSLRVYDWRSEAKAGWFQADGIHYTTAGYVERGARIADALAVAFPAGDGSSAGCNVGSR